MKVGASTRRAFALPCAALCVPKYGARPSLRTTASARGLLHAFRRREPACLLPSLFTSSPRGLLRALYIANAAGRPNAPGDGSTRSVSIAPLTCVCGAWRSRLRWDSFHAERLTRAPGTATGSRVRPKPLDCLNARVRAPVLQAARLTACFESVVIPCASPTAPGASPGRPDARCGATARFPRSRGGSGRFMPRTPSRHGRAH